MHPARQPIHDLLRDCRQERSRGSGPGGQHRNRVETEVRWTHLPTGIKGAAGERRQRKANEAVALKRLRLNLALQHRTPLSDDRFVPPGAYEPSEAWSLRRRGERIKVNPEHEEFPALLAEVLDLLDVYEDHVARTAAAFRVTRSQLVKFLALAPQALAALNERRKAAGKHPLR